MSCFVKILQKSMLFHICHENLYVKLTFTKFLTLSRKQKSMLFHICQCSHTFKEYISLVTYLFFLQNKVSES